MPSKFSLGMLCRPTLSSGLWGSGGGLGSWIGGSSGSWNQGYNTYPQYGTYMGRLW